MSYIYNPRVANEPLVPYKKFFAEAVPQELQSKFRSSLEALRQWCVATIQIDNSYNPLTYPIEPIGVWKSQKADTHSRNYLLRLAGHASLWAGLHRSTG